MQTMKHLNTSNRKFLKLPLAAPFFATAVMLAGVSGCRSSAPQNTPATIIDNNPGAPDPANANLAPVASSAPVSTPRPANVRVLGAQQSYTPQQSTEQYPQQQPPPNYPDANQPNNDSGVNAGYDAIEEASQPPPPLPVYDQPPAPEPNDLWTPGYWNYGPQGYFWVPGAWVAAPYAGALWTPGYWGYEGNRYRFHGGFWARHIGFYGGINYGFGYTGLGYSGGYWNGNNFYYNRAVNRVNVTNIHNVYERNVVVDNVTRVSYNGGNGGLQARPSPRELAVLHEQRTPAMSTQIQLRQESAQNRQQFFNQNHGQPAQAFATHPIAAERGISTPSAQPFQQRPTDPRQQQSEQQRVSPAQQFGTPQQHALQQQQEQQRNAQAQQQQRGQVEQQQRVQAEQQQHANQQQQEQQRNAAQQQQRSMQQQPHTQQLSPRPEPMQRPEPQPQAQHTQPQQPQVQRPEPQPQAQHTQPQQPQVQHTQPQPQQQHPQPQAPKQEAHPEPHPNPK